MIDVEKNKKDLLKRYKYYKTRIEEVVYPESEYNKVTKIEQEKYQALTETEILKKIRTNLLKQKYNHSIRTTQLIEKLNSTMNNSEFISSISETAGLLHDYGRFIQAIYYNSYYEAEKFYQENGYNGHGEVGSHLLFNLDDIRHFHIEEKYYCLLEPVIKYHQINKLQDNLNLRIDNSFSKIKSINETDKWKLISCMIQMVKDADTYDILYQRLTGEYPIFYKPFFFRVNNMTIDEIYSLTGISIEEIMTLNKLTNKDISNLKIIKLPFEKIDPILLEVPPQIKEKFMRKVYIHNPKEWDLYQMQNDTSYNYNSIIAMWWTIGQFLGNMNFTATLQLIKEENLLQKIYELYPKKYKYLVKEMFEFAQIELLEKRINTGKIYAKNL